MYTKRDRDVIGFIKDFGIASTSTLKYFFFNDVSIKVCRDRLTKLYKNGMLDRSRDNINTEFVYYIKKPKQLLHAIWITESYKRLTEQFEIIYFKKQEKQKKKSQLGSIIPDAVFAFVENGKNKFGFLEVQLNHMPVNTIKYEKYNSTKEWEGMFPVMPDVFIASNKKEKLKASSINYRVLI